jgi:hypothetical protein
MLSASLCPELAGCADDCHEEAGPFWTMKITLAISNIVRKILEIILRVRAMPVRSMVAA